jgi:acetyl-CoA carboxylase carboxyltransferase component
VPRPGSASQAPRRARSRCSATRARPGRGHEELVAEQYTRGKALSTAAAFEIDDVIDPADTRAVLTSVLARAAAGG